MDDYITRFDRRCFNVSLFFWGFFQYLFTMVLSNQVNSSRGLVLIIPEGAWGLYTPWNPEFHAWYEVETKARDILTEDVD